MIPTRRQIGAIRNVWSPTLFCPQHYLVTHWLTYSLYPKGLFQTFSTFFRHPPLNLLQTSFFFFTEEKVNLESLSFLPLSFHIYLHLLPSPLIKRGANLPSTSDQSFHLTLCLIIAFSCFVIKPKPLSTPFLYFVDPKSLFQWDAFSLVLS